LVTNAAPAWLPELAEAIAGVRFGPGGVTESVPVNSFPKLESELLHSNATNSLAIWAMGFLQPEEGVLK
jgi:hypothetical protein